MSLGSDCRTSATSFKTFLTVLLLWKWLGCLGFRLTKLLWACLLRRYQTGPTAGWQGIFLISACDPHSRPCKQFMETPGRHLPTGELRCWETKLTSGGSQSWLGLKHLMSHRRHCLLHGSIDLTSGSPQGMCQFQELSPLGTSKPWLMRYL